MKRLLILIGGLAISCGGKPLVSGTLGEEICDNGKDDNKDSKIDCADPKCYASPKCQIGVEKCDNGIDDDSNGSTDCLDASCQGKSCGTGCTCNNTKRTEANCTDKLDNDGDSLVDCNDPDCKNSCGGTGGGSGGGGGTGNENCTDGIDNDADRAIDCVDSDCSGTSACTKLGDGKPCTQDSQCAGGFCISEAKFGFPNGTCANADNAPCMLGPQSVGCNGGTCIRGTSGLPNRCRTPCTGTGLTGNDKCRLGYACENHDQDTATPNICLPNCSSDEECAGSGTGYGCNPVTKYCEQKKLPGGAYGDPCSSPNDCESGFCLLPSALPNGYCAGLCRGDLNNCGPNGYCQYNTSEGDNVGVCLKSCTAADTTAGKVCRAESQMDYACRKDTFGGQMGNMCFCALKDQRCSTGRNCCHGVCSGFAKDNQGNTVCDN